MLHRIRIARGFVAAALVLSGSLASAPVARGQEPSEAQEALRVAVEEGQKQLEEEQYGDAVLSFTKAIQLSGGLSALPYLQRAKCYLELKEYENALRDLREAVTYGSASPQLVAEAQYVQGKVYLEVGSPDLAVQNLESAAAVAADKPDYQLVLGKALVQAGRASEGERALTKHLESDEESAEAYRFRGQARASQGKLAEGLEDIDRAISIDPDDHDTHFTKGLIHLQLEDYAQAADAMKQAIEKYVPEEGSDLPFVQAHLTRATALEESAKKVEAGEARQAIYAEEKAEVSRLLESLPNRPDLAGVRAAAEFRAGVADRLLEDYKGAVKSFSRAIAENPTLAEAYFRRGICFYYLGEERLAIGDFDQAASIDIDSPRANLWKGRTLAKLGEYYDAIAAYGDAITISDRYVDAYVNRGLAYCQLGEYESALSDFTEAVRLSPDSAENHYYRGMVMARMGDKRRAVGSFSSAIEADEDFAPAYEAMATELGRMGRGELEREYRARATELRRAG